MIIGLYTKWPQKYEESHSRLNIYFIIVNAMADFVKLLWSLWKTLTLNKKYANNSYAKGIYYKLK